MIDVSSSAYSKRKMIKTSGVSNDITKRLYFFNVTDGVSEFKAMEYQRITSFDSKIESGTKVRIILEIS